jgi:hypothetical protein
LVFRQPDVLTSGGIDEVIIEEDTTLDKHLVDTLIHNGGIPRDRIILAYKGESVSNDAA